MMYIVGMAKKHGYAVALDGLRDLVSIKPPMQDQRGAGSESAVHMAHDLPSRHPTIRVVVSRFRWAATHFEATVYALRS